MFKRSIQAISRHTARAGKRVVRWALDAKVKTLRPAPGAGDWIAGVAMGSTGAHRYRLYRPPGVGFGERLPLLVMLHGCAQDAMSFATSTRMNRVAARERFLVLCPEQDRMANAQGRWNWFDAQTGRAQGEAALIMKVIDPVCLLHPADRQRVAVVGLPCGASMAALLATRHPERFKAVAMHSGIPPGTAHSTLLALGAMRGRRWTTSPKAAATAGAASWPPLLVIHGGADTVAPASNAHAAVQLWADAAGARAGPTRSVQRGQSHAMTATDFKCCGSAVATLVEVGRLAHAWSGGAANQPFSDGKGPDASRMARVFAARQFRVGAQP